MHGPRGFDSGGPAALNLSSSSKLATGTAYATARYHPLRGWGETPDVTMMRRPAAAGVMRRATAVVWGRRALSTEARAAANRTAFERLTAADPVLVGLGPALELLPGMELSTILTSGPPQPFAAFVGGQRDAIIGAALFEGLAPDREEASTKLLSGEIPVAGCHDHVRAPVSVLTSQLPLTRCLRHRVRWGRWLECTRRRCPCSRWWTARRASRASATSTRAPTRAGSTTASVRLPAPVPSCMTACLTAWPRLWRR